ncbi:MAG: hypothetical protein K0M55_19975 [Rhizobium sp.]|nr:hypothetical protein [Rhizobium sp.]MBW8318490.1 hypothetical protein [Rhizobium sp.]MBW8445208.1 hypothetical protein [Arenimonas sp.]
MTRPTVLDMDLVVVPREADATMWTAAAVPLGRWRDETFFGSKNDAAVLSYRAALSASPYPTAWDDVRKYVEGLEEELASADAVIAAQQKDFASNNIRNAENAHRAEAAEARIAELEKRLADAERLSEGMEAASKLTFAAQHNPNCPSPWLVRLVGPSGRIDLKPYGNGFPRVKHETEDVLGFGKTFGEAFRAARAYMEGK